MKKTFKFICYTMLSLILSGVITAAVALTSSADSAHAHEYEYGVCDCGEIESGYTKIYTKADLDKIRNNLGGKYVLMNDIIITSEDFPYVSSYYNDETGWLPIGCDFDMGAYYYKFYGVFNGNGHTYDENGICSDCAHPDPDFTPDDGGENNPDGNDPDNTNPDGDPDNGGSDNDPDGDVTDPDENQSVTKPTDPDEDNVQNAVTESCACKCHHTGFIGFLFKIINLINRLFGINPTCQCGVAHYVKPD